MRKLGASKSWTVLPIRSLPASLCRSCFGFATTSRQTSNGFARFCLPKDYIRFKLTGEYATEVSDASGTSLFDVVNRRGRMRCAMRWVSIAAFCRHATNRLK